MPQWDNFDTDNCTVQVTPATDAGEHSAVFSLVRGIWSDGTTANKTIKWTINRASIAKIPAQSGTPKYDGNPKTPTWDANYDPVKMVLNVEAKTNAGTAYSLPHLTTNGGTVLLEPRRPPGLSTGQLSPQSPARTEL